MSRELSLFFASIGPTEAGLLLGAWAGAPMASADARRERFTRLVASGLPEHRAFAYNSARGALSAVLRAAGIGPGSEVLLSAFTCLAVPTAVVAAGATPVYVDIDPRSLNTPVAQLLEALRRPAVRAVVVQHTLGNPMDVASIVDAARQRGVIVIEDCALALGTTMDGVPVGSQGDAAIWSLELSKTLSTGWGGVLLVREPLASKVATSYAAASELSALRKMRAVWQTAVTGLCYQPSVHAWAKYIIAAAFRARIFGASSSDHELRGDVAPDFVAKMPGTAAALAAHQWRRTDDMLRSARIGREIRDGLAGAGFTLVGVPPEAAVGVSPRVSFLVSERPLVLSWFEKAGISAGTWFDGPLTPAPTDPRRFNYDEADYPRARWVADRIVNVPGHVRLSRADAARIIDVGRGLAAAHPSALAIDWPVYA